VINKEYPEPLNVKFVVWSDNVPLKAKSQELRLNSVNYKFRFNFLFEITGIRPHV